MVSVQRLVLLVVTVLAVLVGAAVRSACESGFAQFGVADERLFGLLPTTNALAVVGAVLAFVGTVRNLTVMTYISEVVGEFTRITWPNRDEAIKASTTVVVVAGLAAILIAGYDFVWKNLADLILFDG